MEEMCWLMLVVALLIWGVWGFVMWALVRFAKEKVKGYNSSPFSDEPDPRRYVTIPKPSYPRPEPRRPTVCPQCGTVQHLKGMGYTCPNCNLHFGTAQSLKKSKIEAKPKSWKECMEIDCWDCKFTCGGHHDSKFIRPARKHDPTVGSDEDVK